MSTHMSYQAIHITGLWTVTSIYSLMSSKTTLLTVYPILHIKGIFSDSLSFNAWLCICAKPLLNAAFGLSYMLEYWTPLCRSSKPASCKYFNRTVNRLHGCCCQLVSLIEVNLGYVLYLVDYNCFQFTACYFVVFRITLIYKVSCHVSHIYTKKISCPSLWCFKLLSRSWWFSLIPCM